MSIPNHTVSKLLAMLLFASSFTVLIVCCFRYIVSQPLHQSISRFAHITIAPLFGALLLIILFHLFARHLRSGLPHVVLEFHLGLGRLPFLNLVFQFLSASIALLMGFTVGAISPAVHIGATSSNLIGQCFSVRTHTLRILAASGSAVAITVMLDTPLMAILFVYETIIREFRWRTLLAVSAATLFSHWLVHQIGISPFTIALSPFSISILLLVKMSIFGVVCGLLSSSFLNCIDLLTQKIQINYWKKLFLAGVITALLSWAAPTTMGLGYELLDKLLYTSQPVSLLSIWLIIRFISSASVVALAVPGGALGPCLILGALTGAVFNQLFHFPELQLFVIAGMGALLGAVLHVPLAGILFVLESTNEITLLLPCLLASYCAFYTHQRISKQNNLIELLLARQNVILRNSPSLRQKRLTSPL